MTAFKKIALVTGGSRGLGKNTAISLAEKGLDIVFTYHTRVDEAEMLVDKIAAMGGKAVALQLDASDTGTFDAFSELFLSTLHQHWGRDQFDFLINNAGFGGHAAFVETTEAQFDGLMNVHFKGVFFLTQKLLPFMADGGGIINLSSGLTRIVYPGASAYAAMKAAIEMLTKYQAKELGARKIRSNVVAPGAIETDFGGGRVRDDVQTNAYIAAATALGRVGLPTDIGGVVAFLCTEEAYWINGQRIEVSGGQML